MSQSAKYYRFLNTRMQQQLAAEYLLREQGSKPVRVVPWAEALVCCAGLASKETFTALLNQLVGKSGDAACFIDVAARCLRERRHTVDEALAGQVLARITSLLQSEKAHLRLKAATALKLLAPDWKERVDELAKVALAAEVECHGRQQRAICTALVQALAYASAPDTLEALAQAQQGEFSHWLQYAATLSRHWAQYRVPPEEDNRAFPYGELPKTRLHGRGCQQQLIKDLQSTRPDHKDGIGSLLMAIETGSKLEDREQVRQALLEGLVKRASTGNVEGPIIQNIILILQRGFGTAQDLAAIKRCLGEALSRCSDARGTGALSEVLDAVVEAEASITLGGTDG